MLNIKEIQEFLLEHKIDGWLLADFHARNDIAVKLLGLKGIVTRRSFYFIPAEGDPTGVVHTIEQDKFSHLPGNIIPYSGYIQLEEILKNALNGCGRVAMEYAPNGRLPYIGLVDGGTVELVRSFNIEVISSADLVASFQARISVEQIAGHRMAAGNLFEIKDEAFDYIRDSLDKQKPVTEYQLVRFIMDQFEARDMMTDHSPICAVDSNAGKPHYEPSEKNSQPIRKGSLLLIDLWAKLKIENAVYGDITWMGFTGTADEIPDRYHRIFKTVTDARDRAVEFIRENIDSRPVMGYEIDDACRKVIVDAGQGKLFVHRTGHSITTDTHGTGPNIDNLETEDRRRLQQGHLFSIEPGIYMDDCGFRSEINVLIGHNGAEVTTLPIQEKIIPLF